MSTTPYIKITNIDANISNNDIIQHIEYICDVVHIYRIAYTTYAIIELNDIDDANKCKRLLDQTILHGTRINIILNATLQDIDQINDTTITLSQSTQSIQNYNNNNTVIPPSFVTQQQQYNNNSTTTTRSTKKQKYNNILLNNSSQDNNSNNINIKNKQNINDDIEPIEYDTGMYRNHISESESILSKHIYHTYDNYPIGCTLLNQQHILLLWQLIHKLCCSSSSTDNSNIKYEQQKSNIKTEQQNSIKQEENNSNNNTDNIQQQIQTIAYNAIKQLFTSRSYLTHITTHNIDQIQFNKQYYSVTTHPAGSEYILLCTKALNYINNIDNILCQCYLIHMPDLTHTIQSIDINTIDTNIYQIDNTYFINETSTTSILLGTLAAESGITINANIYYRLWCYDLLLCNNKLLHNITYNQRLDIAYNILFYPQVCSLISTAHRLQPNTITGETTLHGPMSHIHTNIDICKTVHLMCNTIDQQVGLFGNSLIYPVIIHYKQHYQLPAIDEHIIQQINYLPRLPYKANTIKLYYNGCINTNIKHNNNIKQEYNNNMKVARNNINTVVKHEHKINNNNDVKYENNDNDNSNNNSHNNLSVSYLYCSDTSDITQTELLQATKRILVKVDSP